MKRIVKDSGPGPLKLPSARGLVPGPSNFLTVYPLFGPVGQQDPIIGPHNTRDWMVPGYLTSSNSQLFLFGYQGGSRRRALWVQFYVVMSSESPENCFRLIYWMADPYDPTPVEIARLAAGEAPYQDAVGIWKAHPMAIDVTQAFNKLIEDKLNVYLLWQIKDVNKAWRVWSAQLRVFWED